MEPSHLLIAVSVALCVAGALAVLRLALLERGSFWAGPVFGFAAATCIATFAIGAAPLALAGSVVSVLALVQAWALRVGAPRTLAHFAAAPQHRDGTPGWWPRFERDLARYAAARG
jgi:hypothetical protein